MNIVAPPIISRIFPKDQYGKKGSVLQFLIALKQPLDKIQEYLQKHPKSLNSQGKQCMDLTPLAVAVIAGRQNVAAWLVEQKADASLPDIRGFTPLHHAAVNMDEEMIVIVLKSAAVGLRKLCNCMGQTYENIQQAIRRLPSPDDEVVFRYKDADDQIVNGTAAQFRELTGRGFVRETVVTPASMQFLWLRGFEVPVRQGAFATLHERSVMQYENYLKRPTAIYLQKEGGLVRVIADEDISDDAIVCTYAGRQRDEELSSTDDSVFADVDGGLFSNLGPIINDGLPNAVLDLIDFQGEVVGIVRSIGRIRRGEEVFINYGVQHCIKLGLHRELSGPALDQFCKARKLTDLLKHALSVQPRLRQLSADDLNAHLKVMPLIRYIVETPASLASLALRGVIGVDQLRLCATTANILDGLGIEDASLKRVRGNFLALAETIPTIFASNAKDEVIDYLLDLANGKITYRVFIKILEWIEADRADFDWGRLKSVYMRRLEIYVSIDRFIYERLTQRQAREVEREVQGKYKLLSEAEQRTFLGYYFTVSKLYSSQMQQKIVALLSVLLESNPLKEEKS